VVSGRLPVILDGVNPLGVVFVVPVIAGVVEGEDRWNRLRFRFVRTPKGGLTYLTKV
jgi:hypothetical protein